jgi:hypothetical protein
MLQVLRTLADIALWRAGPRELPASRGLLVLLCALYVAAGALEVRVGYGRGGGFLYGVEDFALTFAGFSLVLLCARKGHRLIQTLVAVFGTALLFAPPDLLILSAEPLARGHAFLPVGLALLWLTMLVWNLLVLAHIVRAALESTLALGFAVAATYIALSYLLALETLPAVVPGRGG